MAKYSTEFKMRIVKEYLKVNISFKNLAKKYNISHQEIVKR
ncbi:transposase [Anaerococcus hydrogenalis]|nr:transposase [Anaerococcus hydrogenalis]